MTAPSPFRVAAASYPIERLRSWSDLSAKLDAWVRRAVEEDADLLVFPEYAGIEAALIEHRGPADGAAWCRSSAAVAPKFCEISRALARRYGIWLLGGSLAVFDQGKLVNRAHLHAPDGQTAWQDKQILTPWERSNTPLQRGQPLVVCTTPFGKTGILLCYDGEFPLLARALDADLILMPSCTDDASGQARVQVAARARALENQAVVVHAPLLGAVLYCPLVDANTGAAGIFGPPDYGFPSDGVLAAGALDEPGWTIATIDPAAIRRVRAAGAVRLHKDWPASDVRDPADTFRHN